MRALGGMLLLAACGGDSEQTDVPVDSDTDVASDTDTDTDTGLPIDAQAVLRVLGYELPTGEFGGTVLVDFYREPQPFQADLVPTVPIDTCEAILDSTGSVTPPSSTPSDERPGAGLVRAALDGTALGLANGIANLDGWPTGQTVSFSASGSEIPGFDVPALLVVPAAPLSATGDAQPDGSVDLEWTGAPASSPVRITAAGSLGVVVCSVLDDGRFTVPGADLEAVDASGQQLVTRSYVVIEQLPGVTVTGWAQVSAYAN